MSVAAAHNVPVSVVPTGGVSRIWHQASLVLIGADAAASVAELALPRRSQVYLVGFDAATASAWSMPLNAAVVVLPEALGWLRALIADGLSRVQAPAIAVIGGSGGVGCSTLTAGLAYCATRRNLRSAIVDADPIGGGIDLLVGAESAPGWRWQRLTGAEGAVGDLSAHLPMVDKVALVSMSRSGTPDVTREPMAAVVGSVRRHFGLVVIDAGRLQAGCAREAVRLASCSLLVVAQDVRSVAAAQQVLREADAPDVQVVVRQISGAALDAQSIADVLTLPLAGVLPEDARLRRAAERGEPPGNVPKQPWTKACEKVLAGVLSHG